MGRVLGLIGVLLAVCGLVACGSGDGASDVLSSQDVAAAAARTADVETYRASFEGTTEASGQTLRVSGEGEFEAKSKRGHMTLTSSVAGSEFDTQIVMAWPLVYMRFPPELGAQLPRGKQWVRFDMQKIGEKLGFDFQQLMQAGQADPSQGLSYLRGVTNIETVGEEEVRGIETTHYRGVVDFHRVADELPEARKSIERLIELTTLARIPTDVWVSADGLVRRLKYVYDDMRLAPGQSADMTIEMELYDFGAQVNVQEPPAEEVVDLQKLIENR
jgi:hypothetical protein